MQELTTENKLRLFKYMFNAIVLIGGTSGGLALISFIDYSLSNSINALNSFHTCFLISVIILTLLLISYDAKLELLKIQKKERMIWGN